jgi:hypothetical protein
MRRCYSDGMVPKAHDTAALLQAIDRKLGVLLAVAIADRLPANSRAAQRSLDTVLHAGGLTQAEIATLMGKSQQAVSQALAADEKPSSRGGGRKRRSSTTDGPTTPAEEKGGSRG